MHRSMSLPRVLSWLAVLGGVALVFARPFVAAAAEETASPNAADAAVGAGAAEGAEVTDSLLVVSAEEHALAVLDPVTGDRRAFFRVGLGPSAVTVSPDGRTAVVTNRGAQLSGMSICIVDIFATNLARNIPLEITVAGPDGQPMTKAFHRPSGIAFIPGTRRVLVTCAYEGAVLMVDMDEARVIADLTLDLGGAEDVLVDHTGQLAFVAHNDAGKVSVVRLDRMKVEGVIEAGGGPAGMALHPLRNEIWIVNTESNTISVIDADKGTESMEFACGAMPIDVAFTPDGTSALVANLQEGNVSVFDTESHYVKTLIELERVSKIQGEARPVELAGSFGRSPLPSSILVSPDGRSAWITTRRDDLLTEVELGTWKVLRTVDTVLMPLDVAWSRVSGDLVEPAKPAEAAAVGR